MTKHQEHKTIDPSMETNGNQITVNESTSLRAQIWKLLLTGWNKTNSKKKRDAEKQQTRLKQHMSTMSIWGLFMEGLWNTWKPSTFWVFRCCPLYAALECTCHLATFWVARSLGMRPATQRHPLRSQALPASRLVCSIHRRQSHHASHILPLRWGLPVMFVGL